MRRAVIERGRIVQHKMSLKEKGKSGMLWVNDNQDARPEEMSLDQMKALVENSRAMRFSTEGREALYSFLARVLTKQRYAGLDGEQRGVVRQFLIK